MFQYLDLDYTTWKVVQATITPVYYIDNKNMYILVLVDNTNKIVSKCELAYVPTKDANVLHFETTFKAGATEVNVVDEAIATEVY